MPAPSVEHLDSRSGAKLRDVQNYLERIAGARKVMDNAKDTLHEYMRAALRAPNFVVLLDVNSHRSEYADLHTVIVVARIPGQGTDINLVGTGRSDQEVFDMLRAKLHMLL